MAAPRGSHRRLRVTLVTGVASAGKTSVIQRLLTERDSRSSAVLTCDTRPASAAGVWRQPAVSSLQTLSGELRRLCTAGSVQSVIAELPAATALAPIIAAFGEDASDDEELAELAELEAVVAVIDSPRFFEDYTGMDSLAARGLASDSRDRRHMAQVLAEQIEAADVLVLTQVDRISRSELALLRETLRHMNLGATIRHCPQADVRIASLAAALPSGLEPQGTAGTGISSFVYRARLPFHPERLREQLQRTWPGVLRSRGVFWLATRMSEVGSWSQAGPVWEIARAGYWWASLPRETWTGSARLSAAIEEHWQEPFGDRRQELHFVGWDMDQDQLRTGFDRCLLTPAELEEGQSSWARMRDPFASWSELSFRQPRGGARATLH